jgi:hypothetical protein
MYKHIIILCLGYILTVTFSTNYIDVVVNAHRYFYFFSRPKAYEYIRMPNIIIFNQKRVLFFFSIDEQKCLPCQLLLLNCYVFLLLLLLLLLFRVHWLGIRYI